MADEKRSKEKKRDNKKCPGRKCPRPWLEKWPITCMCSQPTKIWPASELELEPLFETKLATLSPELFFEKTA